MNWRVLYIYINSIWNLRVQHLENFTCERFLYTLVYLLCLLWTDVSIQKNAHLICG